MKQKNIYINSVRSYLDAIKNKIIPIYSGRIISYKLFYRGHNDKSYKLLPGIYRTNGDGHILSAYEYDIYQEILHRIPSAFLDDRTILERLVRMQHYGIPTRLLDVTTNQLIALYFACADCANGKGTIKADGEVLILHAEKENIVYASGVSNISTSGLDIRSKPTHQVFKSIYKRLKLKIFSLYTSMLADYMEKYESTIDEKNPIISGYHDLINIISKDDEENKNIDSIKQLIKRVNIMCSETIKKASEEILSKTKDNNFSKNEKDYFLMTTYLDELQKLLKETIQYSYSLIGINNNDEKTSIHEFINRLSDVTFIYPHRNNERIVRQHGAFLLFPPYYSVSERCPDEIIFDSIFIKKHEKQQLLEELSWMGIDEAHLFPEIDVQARHVKAMFSKKTSD